MRDIFRRPYRGTLFVPANRLSSPNDRAESLLLTSIGKLNLSATFYSRESLRYFVKCLQGARLEIPIVSRQSCHLVPRAPWPIIDLERHCRTTWSRSRSAQDSYRATLSRFWEKKLTVLQSNENWILVQAIWSGMARESLNVFTIQMNNFKITMWLCESN